MKYLFATLLLALSFNAQAFLAPEQTDSVLKQLNQYCGDAWCEGFYEIEFSDLKCSRGSRTCKVELTFTSTGATQAHILSCVIERVRVVDDLLKDVGTASERLTPAVVNGVNSCVEHFYSRILED